MYNMTRFSSHSLCRLSFCRNWSRSYAVAWSLSFSGIRVFGWKVIESVIGLEGKTNVVRRQDFTLFQNKNRYVGHFSLCVSVFTILLLSFNHTFARRLLFSFNLVVIFSFIQVVLWYCTHNCYRIERFTCIPSQYCHCVDWVIADLNCFYSISHHNGISLVLVFILQLYPVDGLFFCVIGANILWGSSWEIMNHLTSQQSSSPLSNLNTQQFCLRWHNHQVCSSFLTY